MSIYKTINGPRNDVRFTKDGRLFSKKNIPANIYRQFEDKEVGHEVNDEGVVLEAPVKECVFCGSESKLYKLINSQTIYLCDEDYYDKNTGQIVQQVRENNKDNTDGNGKSEG